MSLHKRDTEELLELLKPCPPVGARFLHYKGGEYEVTGCGIDEKTGDPCVFYRHVDRPEIVWVRPLWNWYDKIETTVERFTHIKGTPQ